MEHIADKVFDEKDYWIPGGIEKTRNARHYFRLGFIARGNWDEEQDAMDRDYVEQCNQENELRRG